LQKNRDLEFRLASLEEEKTAQAETLNGVIHDLEVEVSQTRERQGIKTND
jgi:uncharacterized coiled-coil protein SlyX